MTVLLELWVCGSARRACSLDGSGQASAPSAGL
jgi:hypothetical protein